MMDVAVAIMYPAPFPASRESALTDSPMVTEPAGVLAVLLAVLALIFWFGSTRAGERLFSVVPVLRGKGKIPFSDPCRDCTFTVYRGL